MKHITFTMSDDLAEAVERYRNAQDESRGRCGRHCPALRRRYGLLQAHPFNDRDDWLYEDPGPNPPRKAQGVKLAKRRRFPENSVHGSQEVQYEA